MRRDEICKPSGCDDHIEVRDEKGFLIRRERCALCPLDQLDESLSQHPVLQRAFDIDFALQAGIKVTLDEIDCEEFRTLRHLRDERKKYEKQELDKIKSNQ